MNVAEVAVIFVVVKAEGISQTSEVDLDDKSLCHREPVEKDMFSKPNKRRKTGLKSIEFFI